MSEKWKQKILLLFPFLVLLLGMIFTLVLFLHTYRQIAFEHISAFCEVVIENSPETESQLLAGLKDYSSLTEQELRGNNYLGNMDIARMLFVKVFRLMYCFFRSCFLEGLPVPLHLES